ncbi:hypothetical protein LIER_23813 [Lithospermum erythrorhizon]|uniref:Uncharacterized protein n=1 Tax=Lithospermum erythrorhizon TaxID=34254 RepID=A0AAV3QYW1_LITER
MTGCMTLLEYFPLFSRVGGTMWKLGEPRARRWANSTTQNTDPRQLISYRNQLDRMTTEHVVQGTHLVGNV